MVLGLSDDVRHDIVSTMSLPAPRFLFVSWLSSSMTYLPSKALTYICLCIEIAERKKGVNAVQ